MRGADDSLRTRQRTPPGSSPLARGRLTTIVQAQATTGIIPACAGPTLESTGAHHGCPDHPRLRGADDAWPYFPTNAPGSSPLARGRRPGRAGTRGVGGIIPACAGPTILRPTRPRTGRDHPRLRGADSPTRRGAWGRAGSSPLARGRLAYAARSVGAGRIIPACAGPTSTAARCARTMQDHPRLRGADDNDGPNGTIVSGSSPLARGRHRTDNRRDDETRIIPACAGPTHHRGPGRDRDRDHPRLRGADRLKVGVIPAPPGSSPLARGRRTDSSCPPRWSWIIPACAGPTGHLCTPRASGRGSSPLARGRLVGAVMTHRQVRIIPACAGPTRTSGCR